MALLAPLCLLSMTAAHRSVPTIEEPCRHPHGRPATLHSRHRMHSRAVLLTYVYGNSVTFRRDLCNVFVRSFIATASNRTDLVVMHELPQDPPCAEVALPSNVQILAPPAEKLRAWQANKTRGLLYRYYAFEWFLENAEQRGWA